MKSNIKKFIKELRKRIRLYNHYYYNLNRSLVSDFVYDKYFKRLKELEIKYPEYINSDSPTQLVGVNPSNCFKKIFHKKSMLSLSNVYSFKELKKFFHCIYKKYSKDINSIFFTCEPKFDGIAINLIYEDGKLVHAVTRGNGLIGEDVTVNVKNISEIPLILPKNVNFNFIEIRGEIYIAKKDFLQANKIAKFSNKSVFATARNAASGVLRRLNNNLYQHIPLSIYCYGIGAFNGFFLPNSHFFRLQFLKNIGFKISSKTKLVKGLDSCFFYYEQLRKSRMNFPYEIDGIVCKVDDICLQNKLGYSARFPKYACAYKFLSMEKESRVISVDFQVSRFGILTPVAKLDPICINGVVIKRVTLNNFNDIRRKDIRIGDFVKICRSGDVIPKISSIVLKKRSFLVKEINFPRNCPVCNSLIISNVKRSIFFCTGGLFCFAQLKQVLKHFSSNEAMNIRGIGISIINKLVEINLVKSISDLYSLQANDFLKIPGIGLKSSKKLFKSIENSKNTTFARFLYALGIKGIGTVHAHLLSSNFQTVEDLKLATLDNLLSIKNIGLTRAKNILLFLNEKKNLDVINKLLDFGISWKINIKLLNNKNFNFFSGKIIVFTGTLIKIKRKDIKMHMLNIGAIVNNHVSKNTNYLIKGVNPGLKLNKAIKLGIDILNEDNFFRMLKMYSSDFENEK
ncbi:NAD-dependent DNA ligase LigA [Candidatus Legionella polyplacis]|uniref:DNA ligase n=1 Tax=Candidatus Legionella polyplacis TaxID=2005262 RepID=A0ABZ2H094_9GAMM